ncbi:MAG: extracellular solute-binding protein [Nitrospiraceae bacterium]|nr:extracellular solute-binding protein [Nitrospiraceae bacterium]
MRRAVLLACVLCAAAGAFGADTVTIYYWGSEGDTLALDIIQDFERSHDGSDGQPAIKVIMGQSARINKTDDPQRLMTAVAGGDPPDLVWFDRFAVGEWAARGAFMSLQSFLERDLREHPDDPLTIDPKRFYHPCWAEANYQGELFAIPADTDNRCLYYNKDLLDKYAAELISIGCVDPDDPTKPGPPRTWAQLKQCAEIMTEYDEKGRLKQVGFIPNFGNSWLYIYGWLNGGRFMSEDGLTCTLNSPEIVDALVYMTEIYDLMGGAKAVTAFQSTLQTGDLDPFLSGKVAMKIDGNPFVNSIANQRRDLRFGIAMAPAPEGRQPLGWCGGWCWVIPKGARHPEEAWQFAKYLASRRAFEVRADASRQAARAGGNVFIPTISARIDITEWAMAHYLYDDPTIDEKFKSAVRVFVDAMPYSKYRPVTPVGQLLWNCQVRGMDAGIYKFYDPLDIRKNAQISLDKNAAVVQLELDRIFKPEPYPVISWTPVVGGYVVLIVIAVAFGYWFFGRRMPARGYFRREFHAGHLFVLPWFIGFLVFGGGPIFFSFIMSFCKYNVLSPPQFVGFQNFVTLFTNDPLFYKSLLNTLFMALGIPLSMIVGLAIAMLLNYNVKGMAVYRTFFYLPAIMPAVAASILWIWIFNPQEGIINNLLAQFGITGPAWLQDQYWSKPALIIMGLWGAGAGMIVWLAGLKGIPKHLYEAAEIDGAGRFQKFWNVTLPMISPYILFNLIMGLIGTFQIFTQAYIMTQGGPVDSTMFYAYNLFNNAFRYMKMGYASALAWILFGIILILTVLALQSSKKWVHYESNS